MKQDTTQINTKINYVFLEFLKKKNKFIVVRLMRKTNS